MNMLKKNGGFTLVELVVVIAILAILAGIAIPNYSGYITKAKDTAALVELDAVKLAAQAAYVKEGTITKITVSSEGAISAEPALGTDFSVYFGGTSVDKSKLTGSAYENGAVWTPTGGWQAK